MLSSADPPACTRASCACMSSRARESTDVSGMAAPSSTVPVDKHSGVLMYLNDALLVTTSEAASLVQDVPVMGIVCKAFLSFKELVDTAKSNKVDLATLLNLCDVVIKGLLDKRSDRSDLFTGFKALEECVARAHDVAKRCNGGGIADKVKRGMSAAKICKDIASVRSDLLAFCTANDFVLSKDTNEKLDALEKNITLQLQRMEKDSTTQKAMEKEMASITQERDDLRNKLENERAEFRRTETALAAMEADVQSLQAKADSMSAKEGELVSAQEKLEGVRKDVALKAKELESKEAALIDSNKALAAMKMELEEQRQVADKASKVKIPPGAPRVLSWYTERTAVVSKACDRLGIGGSTDDAVEEPPRIIGLAGPGGAGKSTVAAMVVARVDVRASFYKGVLWLHVGQGANGHLPELMLRLAGMVYEIVMLKSCRPPQAGVDEDSEDAGVDKNPEDGAAYIREVVNDGSRRFLVVADDVWDAEVLRELERAGVWVLYTTRHNDLLPERPLRLDEVEESEAEMVLRKAAGLDDDARLPEAAYKLMRRCEFGVLHLAFVGRWGEVRDRDDEEAWQRTLGRIEEAQKAGKDGKPLSWRAAVLRAGLEELANDNPQTKDLYLSLAVLPKGLAFPSEVAAVLLYGEDFSARDLEKAGEVAATLERMSIVTMRGGGKYSVHDEHADFVQGCFEGYQGLQERVLPRWREYISSVGALVTFSTDWLVKIWVRLSHRQRIRIPLQPYDEALKTMDPSGAELPIALRKVADFQAHRKDWLGAYNKLSQLLEIEEKKVGVDHPDVAHILYDLGKSAYMAGRMGEAEELHRRALAIREKELGVDHLQVAFILYQLGLCIRRSGRVEEAGELCRRALAIREKKLGVDHPDVARTLYELGLCVNAAGRMGEAEGLCRRALAIREAKLGFDHLGVAYTLHGLGNLLSNNIWRTKEAEEFYRRALAIREEKLGANHPEVARTLHDLGMFLSRARRTQEAEGLYRRALAIREKLGFDHPDVASTLHSLGVCLFKAGRTEEAEGLSRRALAIREAKLGFDHLGVAFTLHGLGKMLSNNIWRTKEAEEFYRRALAIREEKLGAYHPGVADTLHNLGMCLGKAGRTEEAEGMYRRALAIREKLGVDHPDVASTLHEVGVCVSRAGRRKEAEEFYRRALAIREAKLGFDHPDVARTLHELGVCLSEAGKAEEAEKSHRRALAIREAKLGVDHPDVASTLHEVGVCVSRAGRRKEAEEFYRRALAIREAKLGFDHPDVARTLHAQGVSLSKGGKVREAEAFFGRALAIREAKLGVDHPDVALTMHYVGVCAYKAGRTEEAEQLYLRALAIREAKLGADHTDVAVTLHQLGLCLAEAGRKRDAVRFYERALAIREEKLGFDHPQAALTRQAIEGLSRSRKVVAIATGAAEGVAAALRKTRDGRKM